MTKLEPKDFEIDEFYRREVDEIEDEYKRQVMVIRDDYETKLEQLKADRIYRLKKLRKELFGIDGLLTVDSLVDMLAD